jgi:hypothetical protein
MDEYEDFEFEDDADEFDDFGDFEDEEVSEGESDNRTFWIVAGGLGIILVLALVCMVVYAMVILPGRREAQSTQAAEINAQNTQVAMAAEMTAQAQVWTYTPTVTNTPAPATVTSSPTPVLAPTDTPAGSEPTEDPRTATVSALLTQQAGGGLTTTPTTTQLPNTGFADDFGIPGMIALAAALVVVIFLARRLRTANS